MADPPQFPGPDARLVVRGVNWLGDAVMTTPALQRLREAQPACHIALLTNEKLRDLWQHHPAIDEVLLVGLGESPWSVGRRLRALRFQTVLVLPNSIRAGLEAWLARIPRRIGYARLWRNAFLSEALPDRAGHVRTRKRSKRQVKRLIAGANPSLSRLSSNAHQIHEYLNLAAAVGANPVPVAPSLFVTPREIESAALRFELSPGVKSDAVLFGLNAGAEYGPAKRWPSEKFISAARELQKRTKCTWLIFGGASDGEIAATITAALERGTRDVADPAVHNLAGKTTLRELLALLKLCRVLLTNDTGPMHVAAALGTPVVVPFGSTSPALTGPGLPGDPRHRVLQTHACCAPCFRRTCPIDFRCMHGISVEQVVEAVLGTAA